MMFWVVATTVVAFFMATAVIIIRVKAAKKPVSAKKIILPPIFMSTGAFMFVFPVFRVAWIQVLEAIVVGMIFSILLIKTTKFEIRSNDIYITPSKAFIFILFGLLIVRVGLKLIMGQSISLGETSGMFFLLAFGMIVTWRLSMLYKYKQLEKQLKNAANT